MIDMECRHSSVLAHPAPGLGPMILLLLLPLVQASQPASGPPYLSLPASAKLDLLWSNIQEEPQPATWPSSFRSAALLLERMCPTFLTPGDEMPAGRKKWIHSVGAVGRLEWRDRGGHNYTGVFQVT